MLSLQVPIIKTDKPQMISLPVKTAPSGVKMILFINEPIKLDQITVFLLRLTELQIYKNVNIYFSVSRGRINPGEILTLFWPLQRRPEQSHT